MSQIDLIKKDKAKLVSILFQYEDELKEVENNLRIKGKKLEEANRENAIWQHYYDQRKIELGTLRKYFEQEVARVRGTLFKTYTESNSRDLSDRAKDKYIDHEKAYLDTNELLLEVQEMYEKYESVVDAFRSRGYALNNITKLRCASLEDVMM